MVSCKRDDIVIFTVLHKIGAFSGSNRRKTGGIVRAHQEILLSVSGANSLNPDYIISRPAVSGFGR